MLAGLAAWASALAFAPAGVIREVASPPPGWRLHLAAAAVLMLVEAAVFALAPGATVERALVVALVAAATAVAAFDLLWRVIPDLYVLAIAVPGLFGPLAPGWFASAAGAALAGGLLWGVGSLVGRRLRREALGFGDVKLATALGCLLGPVGVLWTVFGASALGAVAALAIGARAGRREVVRLPFGAFLAPAGIAVLWMQRAA